MSHSVDFQSQQFRLVCFISEWYDIHLYKREGFKSNACANNPLAPSLIQPTAFPADVHSAPEYELTDWRDISIDNDDTDEIIVIMLMKNNRIFTPAC